MLPATVPVITPLSSRFSCPRRPRRLIPSTSASAASAPVSAPSGMLRTDSAVSPLTMTSAAPTPAPPEIPRMNGSASGLRRIAWNTMPDSASEAPTVIAASIRSRRRSATGSSRGLTSPRVNISAGEIQNAPAQTPRISSAGSRISGSHVIKYPVRGSVFI